MTPLEAAILLGDLVFPLHFSLFDYSNKLEFFASITKFSIFYSLNKTFSSLNNSKKVEVY